MTRVDIHSRFVMVDSFRTHYLEAGDGPTVVLLHAGGFGENAELSWGSNIATLAAHHRVIAPDWLGFGKTDKVRDFVRGNARMLEHMARFFEVLAIAAADIMGLSMGGTFLLRDQASDRPLKNCKNHRKWASNAQGLAKTRQNRRRSTHA